MKKVIFVCHGNICRSPMAEFIAKSLTDKYEFSSRAVSNEEYGNDIYPPAKTVLRKNNIPFTTHFAKRITLEEYNEADLIFVMDNSNMIILKRVFVGADYSKIRLLDPLEIEDPWYSGNFDKVYNQIRTSIIHFLSEEKI